MRERDGEEFEQLITRFCVERFLYRFGTSPHAGRFLLKRAMLFVAWEGRVRRPTRDLDLLGFGDINPKTLSEMVAAAPSFGSHRQSTGGPAGTGRRFRQAGH